MQKLLSLILCVTLCGCVSTHQDSDREADHKIATAKINTQLGMAYLENHDVQRAKRKFLTALEEAPNIPDTWYSMGYFLEATGETAQAKTYYEKALTLGQDRGDAHNNFGTYLCRNGEYQEAIHQFQLAVRDLHYIDTAGAYENAGLCALKIPDPTLAETFFKKSVQENPERSGSYLELAQLAYAKKDYESAQNYLDHFLRLSNPTKASERLSEALSNPSSDENRL